MNGIFSYSQNLNLVMCTIKMHKKIHRQIMGLSINEQSPKYSILWTSFVIDTLMRGCLQHVAVMWFYKIKAGLATWSCSWSFVSNNERHSFSRHINEVNKDLCKVSFYSPQLTHVFHWRDRLSLEKNGS